jgi:NAD+ diphosphatase
VSDRHLFVFDGYSEGRVLVPIEGGPLRADALGEFEELLENSGRVSFVNESCDLWGLTAEGIAAPGGCEFKARRDLVARFGADFFVRSGAAFQAMSLYANNKFCGRCGEPMRYHARDLARECPSCGRLVFPSLCPAVIVAVEKDGMLLMGHNANFPQGRYSVLAGFVEPGETLERTVAREVYEESSVRVKNIRYFCSQPWPFPASMMLAFNADWESGEPTPDGEEITDVRWFSPDNLPAEPNLPPTMSISRMLVEDWLRRRGA